MILRHTFTPHNNARLSHLCGPADCHLRTIEAALQVSIAHRHEQFKVDGTKARAAATPTPGDFPRVSGNEQKARDSDRRAILDKELANELQSVEKAKKALSDAGNQPVDKLQPLRDTVALHERNVESLKKELGNLR